MPSCTNHPEIIHDHERLSPLAAVPLVREGWINTHGVRMRNALHREAQAKGVDIACRAQNDKVADYYMTERPGAMVTAGARPYLQWQYREPVGEVVMLGKSFDPFGFSSTRDSGQLPLA